MQWTKAANGVPFLCVLILIGAALWSIFAPAPLTPELDAVVGPHVKIEGVVIVDPDVRGATTQLTLDVLAINGILVKESGRVLVSLGPFEKVAYGDRVLAEGTLKRPEPFETDLGRTFDYPKYLRAHGITHQLSFAHTTVLSHGEGSIVTASLLSVKHFFIRGIERALPEPESALLAGLLLGEKQSLGDSITQAFRNAGVVHIIVLSGYNVSLVIAAIMFVAARFLPRAAVLTVAVVGIIAFAIMTGASETTIRASIMALIVILAQALHRPTDALRILLIAAAGMAVWNPYLVLYDLSYQLSILATLGLILFSEPIAKNSTFATEKFGFREILATTIATQITVLPLLIVSVGSVSLVSLVANVFVLPAIPAAMLAGFVATLLALISPIVAFPVSTIAYGILTYIIHVAVFLGSLPFAAIHIPTEMMWVALSLTALIYIAAGAWLFRFKQKIFLLRHPQ